MLRSMAEKEGFHHEETLTGFKWLGNKSLSLVEQGYVTPYAFEEAIGYMFSDIVRDKDGIAAATVFLSLVQEIGQRGQTVYQLLNELYEKSVSVMEILILRYGYFASQNWYVRCEDPAIMTNMFYKLRHQDSSISYIQNFGEYRITRINDVSLGYDSRKDSTANDISVSPSSEMITFELNDSTVVTLRGSGTEPKLKYYIESKGKSIVEAKSKAEAVEKALLIVLST
jgi:phosphoglucomutase